MDMQPLLLSSGLYVYVSLSLSLGGLHPTNKHSIQPPYTFHPALYYETARGGLQTTSLSVYDFFICKFWLLCA
jgi:hypothetical protein